MRKDSFRSEKRARVYKFLSVLETKRAEIFRWERRKTLSICEYKRIEPFERENLKVTKYPCLPVHGSSDTWAIACPPENENLRSRTGTLCTLHFSAFQSARGNNFARSEKGKKGKNRHEGRNEVHEVESREDSLLARRVSISVPLTQAKRV